MQDTIKFTRREAEEIVRVAGIVSQYRWALFTTLAGLFTCVGAGVGQSAYVFGGDPWWITPLAVAGLVVMLIGSLCMAVVTPDMAEAMGMYGRERAFLWNWAWGWWGIADALMREIRPWFCEHGIDCGRIGPDWRTIRRLAKALKKAGPRRETEFHRVVRAGQVGRSVEAGAHAAILGLAFSGLLAMFVLPHVGSPRVAWPAVIVSLALAVGLLGAAWALLMWRRLVEITGASTGTRAEVAQWFADRGISYGALGPDQRALYRYLDRRKPEA